MKNKFSLILAAIFGLAISVQALPTTVLINGPLYTNATVVVGASTNQYGVVLGAATNSFNLSSGIGTQLNTNLWPSAGFSLVGYPNTLYGPFSTACIAINGALTATNASSTTITYRFAASNDGTLWVTNYASYTQVIAVNSTTATMTLTNVNFGAIPYLALSSIENPGVAAVTNIVISVSGKNEL